MARKTDPNPTEQSTEADTNQNVKGITPIQQEIWTFIHNHVQEHGYPPTLRELGDAFNIASTNGIRYHLKVLTDCGYIAHRKGSRRGLQLLKPDGSSPFREGADEVRTESARKNESAEILHLPDRHLPEGLSQWWKPMPIIGRVAAGSPILAEENREDEIGVDQAIFGGGPNVDLFGLHIAGDSMYHAGIHDGDLVIVRKQANARPREIIVATVNDEATVKRYLPEPSRIILKAENPDYDSIYVTPKDRFRIIGVVVGLIRKNIY